MSNIFYLEAMRKVEGLKTLQLISDITYEHHMDQRYLLVTLASCFRAMVLWYFDRGGAEPDIEAELEILNHNLPDFYRISGFFKRSQTDVSNALASKDDAILPEEGNDICCEYIVKNIDFEKDRIQLFDFSEYYQSTYHSVVCECKKNGWAYKTFEKRAKEYVSDADLIQNTINSIYRTGWSIDVIPLIVLHLFNRIHEVFGNSYSFGKWDLTRLRVALPRMSI